MMLGQAAAGPGSRRTLAQRPCASILSRRRLNLRCSVSDHSVRVKGDLRRVFTYVSDLEHLKDWYPGVSAVQRVHGSSDAAPLAVRTQFQVQQSIAGFKIPTVYEVVDVVPNKRVVYAAKSELHTATDQLIFMPDPNDSSFTIVRYMSQVQLTQWRRALQPVVSTVLAKLPENGLNKLTQLLSSSNTPLRNIHVEEPPKKASWGRTASSWSFKDMFASGSSKGTEVIRKKQDPDAMGFYKVLGLETQRRSVSTDDVKAAFRRAAMTMHPDKLGPNAGEAERRAAELEFQKLQRAYEVLRDPEQKRLYDTGKLQLELEESNNLVY